MTKIYLADDDKDILRLLEVFLKSEGYDVSCFATGDDLYAAFQKEAADLVILDIMMPGSDGLTICQKLRAESAVPIILLTAKDSDADYVAGITLGSDDYLVKPFKPTLLSMRVKALLRRVAMTQGGTEQDLHCADLIYNHKARNIYVADVLLNLTKTEFECLVYMMRHFNEAISRQQLLEEIWGYDNIVETRVTDETIRKIRKKLKLAASRAVIKNKWGYGYSLEEVVD